MELAQFWNLVAASRGDTAPGKPVPQAAQAKRLRALLDGLAPAEIIGFQRCFDQLQAEGYRWDLWAAAYILQGGCSDDGFIDFRSWLTSMGREVYEAALADVESLAALVVDDDPEATSFEAFGYAAYEAYEHRTGTKMPVIASKLPDQPAGDRWAEDGDELQRRWPKLWAASPMNR
jgi:hypothetical protein